MLAMLAMTKNVHRIFRDAAGWRSANLDLLFRSFVDRDRNRRAAYADRDHLMAAATWLECAQDSTGDGGIAGRYSLRSGWTSSYPETTGYLVPTLLSLEQALGQPRFAERARRCVDFLLSVQLESGAFPGMEIAHNRTEPSVFNSAQIICGLRAWHQASNDERAIKAAERACDWLIAEQDGDGAWRKHIYGETAYTYMAHAACWIAELGAYLGRQDYLNAARAHLEWVLSCQDPITGFFDNCGFSAEEHRQRRGPTHTIAYTIWGVLMTSRILGHDAGMQAARKAACAVARRLELSRWLPGVLDHRWRGCATYACLTGNAQMALIWLELHRLHYDPTLLSAACKAIDLIKRAQPMTAGDTGVRGGIPGSDPVWGDYISLRIPNWAAKFYIDALIEQRAALDRLAVPPHRAPVVPHGMPVTLPDLPMSAGSVPRTVLYASPRTHKVQEMIESWSSWGFRPTTVVVSNAPEPGVLRRLAQKIRDDGAGAILRRAKFWDKPKPPSARESTPHGAAPVAHGRESVAAYCRRVGIDLVQVDGLDTDLAVTTVAALAPDLAIHAGAGILRKPILDIPRLGTLNAHMGLLPAYRGMNVAEWARLLGDPVGVTVHLIDTGIDTGDILCCRAVSTAGMHSISELRAAVNMNQLALLGEVVRYVIAANALPPRYAQRADQGRQYYVMHQELRERLEQALGFGGAS